ncbi:MAG: PQ-loop repeat-containing protein [Candidatus Heimdallarchaeaceae archaeon]
MNKELVANLLIYLAGILWCLDLLPQIAKTIKTKKAEDLNIMFLLMSFVAFIVFKLKNGDPKKPDWREVLKELKKYN